MSLSVYTRLTNLIAVRDVLTPVQGYIDQSCTIGEAIRELDKIRGDSGLPYLVREDGRVVGAVWYSHLNDDADERNGDRIDGEIQSIKPDQLIAADTKLWRAAHALIKAHAHDPLLFVLEGDEIIGTFSFYDLFKPPFLVCLFALTVEVETTALRLCSRDAAASWAALSPGRQMKALRSLEFTESKRRPTNKSADRIENIRKHPWRLLEYTCFADKKEIIRKRRLLPEEDRRWLEGVFNAAEELRNRCAHPDNTNEPFMEVRDLLKRIQDCHALLAKIKKVIEPVENEE